MTIEEALQEIGLFRDTEQGLPSWRWYKRLGVRNQTEWEVVKANIAAGLGG